MARLRTTANATDNNNLLVNDQAPPPNSQQQQRQPSRVISVSVKREDARNGNASSAAMGLESPSSGNDNAFTGIFVDGRIAALLPGRLYFASLARQPPRSDTRTRFLCIDDRVHYDPFYHDFGPVNEAVLYRFCLLLDKLVKTQPDGRRIFCWTASDDKARVNGAYIVASYLIIYHGMTADAAYLRVRAAEPPSFIGFRDAAMGPPTYFLHLHDVLRSVQLALEQGWLDFATFDATEYEKYERVESGDLNWCIPGKIIAFCGPHNESYTDNGYPYHAPSVYFDYFRKNGVSTIVRLNMKMYERQKFIDAGFDHQDLFFVDGSTPSDDIVIRFLQIVDTAKGAVAVHCKAGLGRTGTLIACWMMKQFGCTAAEAIAWLRICRPGSVIGPQQQFLVRKQNFCWALGNKTAQLQHHHDASAVASPRVRVNVSKSASCSEGLRLDADATGGLPRRSSRRSGEQQHSVPPLWDETAVDAHGRTQGDRLLQIKARSQQSHQQPLRVMPSSAPLVPMASSTRLPRIEAGGGVTTGQLSTRARFSSPTTPVKPGNSRATVEEEEERNSVGAGHAPRTISPPTGGSRSTAAATLRQQAAQEVPISRVTVTSSMDGHHPLRPQSSRRNLMSTLNSATAASPHSSTAHHHIATRASESALRSRPYPAGGVRVEVPPTTAHHHSPVDAISPKSYYELRSRRSFSVLDAIRAHTAVRLPPNSAALGALPVQPIKQQRHHSHKSKAGSGAAAAGAKIRT